MRSALTPDPIIGVFMKTAPLLLLSALTFNTGCTSCGKGKPESSTVKPASEAPVAASNTVIPSKETVTAVFFTAKDRTVFWMETVSGTHKAPPDTSFWTGESIIVPQNAGWRTYLTDGSNYGSTAAPKEGLTTVASLLASESAPPAGYAWEIETTASGFQKVFIKPALGKRQRIGNFPEPPSAPSWKEGTRPAARGAEVAMLNKASGFQANEDGKTFKNAPPVGSTPIAVAAASAEDLTAWSTALSALRAAPVTIDLSQMLDLNGDNTAEGFICVSGGQGNPCYVVDVVGEETRYYTTTVQWSAGQAEMPQYFSTETGSYISHSPAGATTNRGTGIIRLVRFDGSGYATEAIQ